MAILKWHGYMLPVLEVLAADQAEVRRRDLIEQVAAATGITDDDRKEFISSGQAKYVSRVSWAITYLRRVRCLDRPKRAYYSINDLGRQLKTRHPNGITEKQLAAFAEEHGIKPSAEESIAKVAASGDDGGVDKQQDELTPTEQIEAGVERMHDSVATELLQRLHANDPAFFEQAVLDLLMAMGYGGALGKATRTQLSNDGGIDGVIDQDALGLSRIYVQAKRYALTSRVSRPEIQAFVGALHGVQANQSVFLTTAQFTAGAEQYAESLNVRVVLIDGPRLARLMIRYGVGVQVQQVVNVVEVDEDFFE